MSLSYSVIIGKTVRSIARLRGGGSALPGLFVEKIDSNFITKTLAQLPEGVVVVSGTNGKTTTTKMLVELLEGQGLTVFTNRTGSNFTRGVAAALLGEVNMSGNLNADIAVLELDEAHAVHFVRAVKPRYSLLLNVLRDQLDRFGEIDTTAAMLKAVADATTETVIVNREDPRLHILGEHIGPKKTAFFGLSPSLLAQFPSDDTMRDTKKPNARGKSPPAICTLESLRDKSATFTLHDETINVSVKIDGIYNIYNAAAAFAAAYVIVPNFDKDSAVSTLANIEPAFGRGETIMMNGQPIELVLVKNPSGFRLSLQSFPPAGYATMIAINDNYADGRDMSWLWDVEFDSLATTGVSSVTGIRANDMALRLQYDEVLVRAVDTDIPSALNSFLHQHRDSPKRIFCTYTAMLAIRKLLSKQTTVKDIS